MKHILTGFIAIIVLAWGLELFAPGHLSAGSLPWAAYQEGLHLSGLLAIAMMSLAMVLATRPVWLEGAVGGMDRVYRLHKWSGIIPFLAWLESLQGPRGLGESLRQGLRKHWPGRVRFHQEAFEMR